MKLKQFLKGVFVLCVVSLCLPWFTYNAKLMGYRLGLTFVKWYALPLVLIGSYLFREKKSEIGALMAEISVIANLVISVVLFGRWQELCNIVSGFQWTDGFHTAQPGFWIAAGLMMILFAAFQVQFCKWQVSDRRSE